MGFGAKFRDLELEDNKNNRGSGPVQIVESHIENRRQKLYRNSGQDNSK